MWERRADRYSETRLAAPGSTAGYQPGAARKLEMIRLGGWQTQIRPRNL
ncbi:MAG: hypothetical protein R2748_23905 [Bryobacterales bacterium]